jgi:hypothetical protein
VIRIRDIIDETSGKAEIKMADSTVPIPASASGGSVGEGIVGMMNVFIDPAATAKRVPAKLSWLWPLLIIIAVSSVISYLMIPFSLEVAEARLRDTNIPAESMARARDMSQMMVHAITYLVPVFVVVGVAFFALLIKVVYQMMGVRPTFRNVFALLACCSLISMLQMVATYIVLRAKGEPIDNQEQLMVPLGLDIFTPGLHGPALAILHFFSLFEIWYIVVLVFGLAALTGSSKSKAFFASMPAWLIPLLFAIVGALFAKPPAA